MKRHLPFALTHLATIAWGPVALVCALTNVPRRIYLPILITGTLSDIYDGILARRFGAATSALRRYDSITDMIYYLFIPSPPLFLLCKTVITQKLAAHCAHSFCSEAGIILYSRLLCPVLGNHPATHSYPAKFYGLCLARRAHRPARLQHRKLDNHRAYHRRAHRES